MIFSKLSNLHISIQPYGDDLINDTDPHQSTQSVELCLPPPLIQKTLTIKFLIKTPKPKPEKLQNQKKIGGRIKNPSLTIQVFKYTKTKQDKFK